MAAFGFVAQPFCLFKHARLGDLQESKEQNGVDHRANCNAQKQEGESKIGRHGLPRKVFQVMLHKLGGPQA